MRLIKTITAIVLVGIIFGNAAGRADSNDIAAYYGFEEIEIVKLDWGIKCLMVADFNGDGRSDIVLANNIKARIELLIQKEAVGPGETPIAVDPEDVDVNTLNPPTRFKKENVPVSQKILSLVCGDLNSDGMMDLAFYGNPKGLYVILQKAGDTKAGKPKTLNWRTAKKILIDDGLVTSNALVCADLNNDGADDLALAGRDVVYIILQKDDGTLAEPTKYPTAALTLGIKVGDLNGDGINDLIFRTNDGEKPIHVRFGLKTGQLGPQVQFFIEKPGALELYNIDEATGDEILTVDAISKRLVCYKFAAEDLQDADWPILLYPLASGQESTKRDLAAGDFDGDGLVDVVISNPGAAELIFYKQTAGLGLTEPVRFPAFADIASLSVADIDNDGKAELGVLSVKEKVIGLSKFEDDRLSFPKPVDLAGEPVAMALADVDRDGSIDCLYISRDVNDIRSMQVIYNVGTAGGKGKAGHPIFGGLLGISKSKQVDETVPALELEQLKSNPDGLKVLDVDQDGLHDVLIFVKYELPILVRQTKKRKFEVVDSPKAQASLIKDATLRSIAIADVDDQTGQELLVAQKNFARSLVFADSQRWSIIDQYNAKGKEDKVSAVAAFDIDGKGPKSPPAILLLDGQKGRLQILKADDDKTYRFVKQLKVGKWNAATHLKWLFGPFTGSAVKSILLFDSEKFALITPPGTSSVPQHLEQRFSYETKIKDGKYGRLTAGDINSDDRVDIVMVEYNRNHIEILTLDPEGKPISAFPWKTFEQKSYRGGQRFGKSGVEPRELKVADVTNDDKDDFIIVIHDRIIIYPQD